MVHRSRRSPWTLAVVAIAVTGVCRPAGAEDFRVDNTVYIGGERQPATESTTIFHAGAVYDFLTKPAEIMIFDGAAGRFALLNLKDRTRTEISTDAVSTMVEQLRPVAAKSTEPLVQFLANPTFEQQTNEKLDELILRSTLVNYRITMSRDVSPEMVQQYREFSDWSARLSMLLTPGALPPFGSLQVHAALAEQKAIPVQVMRDTSSGKGKKPQRISLRSERRIVRPLTPEDLERVSQAQDAVATFELLDFQAYCKAEGD